MERNIVANTTNFGKCCLKAYFGDPGIKLLISFKNKKKYRRTVDE